VLVVAVLVMVAEPAKAADLLGILEE